MDSHFINQLIAEHLYGKWWRLHEPLVYFSAKYNITVTSPKGAVVDFASIPRLPLTYLFFGNTMHEEATIHDVPGYRWGIISRYKADLIFLESGEVRSDQRMNQSSIFRFGRFIRRNLATAAVLGVGWLSYKNYPGCLDYTVAKEQKCEGIPSLCQAKNCMLFYDRWEQCVVQGYQPSMEGYHA